MLTDRGNLSPIAPVQPDIHKLNSLTVVNEGSAPKLVMRTIIVLAKHGWFRSLREEDRTGGCFNGLPSQPSFSWKEKGQVLCSI